MELFKKAIKDKKENTNVTETKQKVKADDELSLEQIDTVTGGVNNVSKGSLKH